MKRVRDMDESDTSQEDSKPNQRGKNVSFEESTLTRAKAKSSSANDQQGSPDKHKHDGDCCNQSNTGAHSHGHNHSVRSTNSSAIPEDYKASVQFKEMEFPKSLDVVAFAYPVFVLVLAYGALIFKDHIVNEEAYDKFHERIEWMSKQTAITSQLLISEIFKHFPVLAFTTLSTFYLIKPIKGSSSTVGGINLLGKGDREETQRYPRKIEDRKAVNNSRNGAKTRRVGGGPNKPEDLPVHRVQHFDGANQQVQSLFGFPIVGVRLHHFHLPKSRFLCLNSAAVCFCVPFLLLLLRSHDGGAAGLETRCLFARQLPLRRLQIQADHARSLLGSLHSWKDIRTGASKCLPRKPH